MARQTAATTRKRTVLLANKIQCAFCEAVLSPAEFRHHEHEDLTYSDYLG